jgi:hypothetical protein
MATYTASSFNRAAKGPHTGVQAVVGEFSFPAASSVGDVVFLAKIPEGAVVVELVEYHSTGATAQALDIGLAAGGPGGGTISSSCYISGGAQATVNRYAMELNFGHIISLSAAAQPRYGILSAKVASGSNTTSLKIKFTVLYSADGTTSG